MSMEVIAMPRGMGRPLAALVLHDEERSFLETRVRRRRIARALADRCRMILRCADGVGNKAVAAELGVHEHTVGKWRRRFVKNRIKALDRTQPILPMLPGMAERHTHDYKRHGTTSLFDALDVATGSVIGKCFRRHRAREFLNFLKVIDRNVPDGLDIHLVMDNYATHKTAGVKAWLARRPHWHAHFTPTPASWLNQVERWFAELTRKQLRRGVHRSTLQLEADIRAFIDTRNERPKPFRWTKSADDILAAVKRFCLRVEQKLMPRTSVSGQ